MEHGLLCLLMLHYRFCDSKRYRSTFSRQVVVLGNP